MIHHGVGRVDVLGVGIVRRISIDLVDLPATEPTASPRRSWIGNMSLPLNTSNNPCRPRRDRPASISTRSSSPPALSSFVNVSQSVAANPSLQSSMIPTSYPRWRR